MHIVVLDKKLRSWLYCNYVAHNQTLDGRAPLGAARGPIAYVLFVYVFNSSHSSKMQIAEFKKQTNILLDTAL